MSILQESKRDSMRWPSDILTAFFRPKYLGCTNYAAQTNAVWALFRCHYLMKKYGCVLERSWDRIISNVRRRGAADHI